MSKKTCKTATSRICSCPPESERIDLDDTKSSKVLKAAYGAVFVPAIGWIVGGGTSIAAGNRYKKYKDVLPSCKGQLDNVKDIDAKWAGLGSIKNIGIMKNLEKVDLSGNVMLLSLDGIENLQKLKNLDLGYVGNAGWLEMGSKEYPPMDYDALFKITSLEEINFFGNDPSSNVYKRIIDNNPGLKEIRMPATRWASGLWCKETGKQFRGRTIKGDAIKKLRECNIVLSNPKK